MNAPMNTNLRLIKHQPFAAEKRLARAWRGLHSTAATCAVPLLAATILLSSPHPASAQDDALTILPNGNVGIGTNQPAATLDVKGTINGIGLVPPGGIVMFSGAINKSFDANGTGIRGTPYEGWQFCNGKNDSPDLRDRFIVGAGSSYQVNAIGGQDTVTLGVAEMPSHTHSARAQGGEHRHVIPTDTGGGGEGWGQERMLQAGVYTSPTKWANANTYAYTFGGNVAQWKKNSAPKGGKGEHNHNVTITASGRGGGHENRPPFFALAYIMKLR